MPSLGRGFVIVGLVFVGLGLVLSVAPPVPWLGRLPGDIRIERPGVRLYFPIATCLLISLILSGILWLISKLR